MSVAVLQSPQVTGSSVGQVAVHHPKQIASEKPGKSKLYWGLLAVSAVIGIAGIFPGFSFIGGFVAHVIDRVRFGIDAKDQKASIAKDFKHQIAAQLGINPESVTVKDLELAAQTNQVFANLIHKVNKGQASDNRASMLGNTASAGLGLIPGMAAATTAVKVGAEIGGHVVGGLASCLFDKDEILVLDVSEHMGEKLKNKQPITAEDVFMLRLAQQPELADGIKRANGGMAFHKMEQPARAAIMRAMPDMLGPAQYQANQVNLGQLSVQDLVIAPAPKPVAWAQRVGGSRAQTGTQVARVQTQAGSQLERVQARRAAPAPVGGMRP